jgi:hypothetical protein
MNKANAEMIFLKKLSPKTRRQSPIAASLKSSGVATWATKSPAIAGLFSCEDWWAM